MSNPRIYDLKANELYPGFLIKEVNKSLGYYVKKYKESPDILKEAIKYSVENSGKRFRPILCLLTAKSLGKDYRAVLPTACAIEFIHTYSLIHDDLPSIDNDDLRRGKPTCHKKFGEDIAVLAGDALFAEAFNIIIKYQIADDRTKIKILEEIADASGASGMAAGQIVDVYFTGKKISKKKLEYMHRNKTGKIITASVRCAAILCGVIDDYLKKFTEYSENLGLAFQITDDILDVTSYKRIAGKTIGKDAIQKKNTFPNIWGISKSKEIARDKIDKAIAVIKSMDIDYKWLVNIANFLLVRKV
ncbi:Farnesyl diphosphate synthase [subsurface metagenome]|jgi:geranylgeranyl diphosphate synthase type II|nr:polyprenyl synthetase family protein [Clostridia bacterium]TET14658.1 MAG: polyprenyl synthetase family protein [Actinomycetota bacterium]